jgi:hypothetical protein
MINDLIKKKNIGIYSLIVGSILCLLAGAGISGAIERYSTAGRIVPVGAAATPQSRKVFRTLPVWRSE